MLRKRLGAVLASGALLAAGCGGPPDDVPTPVGDQPVPGISDGNDVGRASAVAEIKGGRLLAVDVPMFAAARDVQPAAVINAVKARLPRQLGALDAADFELVRESDASTPGGGRLAHVGMQQKVRGVPVHGSYLNFTLRRDESRGVGRAVATSYRLFHTGAVDTAPGIAEADALRRAQARLRVPRTSEVVEKQLELRSMGGKLQLVWSIAVADSHYRALVVANGPNLGRVLTIDERVYEAEGNVLGTHVVGGAPGAAGTPVTEPLVNLNVTSGAAVAVTDGDGAFLLDVADGEPVEARVGGVAAFVADANGSDLVSTAPAGPGMLLSLGDPADGEAALAQTTAYVFADRTRSFLLANGFPAGNLGDAIQTNTSLPDICNAFYDPFARSINFFASGGGCNNSAIDSVVVHEYGHFADDAAGGIMEGGLSEGWGDLLACYVLGAPEIGFDLFPGGAFRSCENDYVFPPGGVDEVHNLGQAWAGFGWLVRQGLIDELGPEDGEALARALVIPSLDSNAPDIPSAVREVFLRDDDDGDLTNETPHWDVLFAAADHHGLAFALETDDIAPAAVGDLAVASASATRVSLTWTATGDDDFEGTASQYDLRMSNEPITVDNFAFATPVPAPDPAEAGTPQSVDVSVPPETTAFFAMVVVDDHFNTSGLSNVVTATTSAGVEIYTEDFEDGAADWTADGLWHVTTRRASSGASAFWYGQEDTGNYDTGDTNSGVLVSPIIDLAGAADAVLVYDQFVQIESFPEFDIANVVITNVDDPSQVVILEKQDFATEDFVARVATLAPLAGGRIQMQFAFDTVDGFANDLEGWYVDHVRIIVDEAGPQCTHDECDEGDALTPECSDCAATVCTLDPFCCDVAWDAFCVQEAQTECGLTCDEPVECTHDVCEAGEALEPACDDCATNVCAVDEFCCTVFWDRVCVQEAEEICGLTCEGCAHDLCAVGEPLDATCDPCTEQVCAADDYCCNNAWDSRCVAEAAEICGLECEQCLHDPCTVGESLDPSCDPCVSAVCAEDEFCCGDSWDARCVEQSQEICGLTCSAAR